ncbi:MAG TPA: thioredoxin family protein [Sumerlaeia bacterium]|nr:thioredoxin family protein [Sumerlaeia bacterium]
MRLIRTCTAILLAMLVAAGGATELRAQEETAPAQKTPKEQKKRQALKPQTVCPIMDGRINKKLYVDADGFRIYACCKGCIAKIKADPAKAVAQLKAKGQAPEVRLALCPKCGQIKGTAKCCAKDAAKCPKCGLAEGSPGCCKDLKPTKGEKDVLLCPKCGQVKGAAACCAKGAAKCPKCGLAKDSPGCCKLPKAIKGTTDEPEQAPKPSAEAAPVFSHPTELAEASEFESFLAQNEFVLVDFYASWCGPCQTLKPTIRQLAETYAGQVRVVKVDVDRFRDLAAKYRIQSIPHVALFQKGKIEKTWTGAYPEKAYTGVLDKLVRGGAAESKPQA